MKNILFTAVVALLLSGPSIEASASSGFSSTKGGSSASKPSSERKSNPTPSATKRDTAPARSEARKDTAVASAKPDYGRNLQPIKPAASAYAPANRATPQFQQKRSEPITIRAAAPVPAPAPIPVPAPKASGFNSSANPSATKRNLAGVAGATALGSALYAASANREAVAAYDEAQRPAPTPAPAKVESVSPAGDQRAIVGTQARPETRTTSAIPVTRPAPDERAILAMARERERERERERQTLEDARYDSAKAYRDGVRDAQRQSRASTQYPEPRVHVEQAKAPREQATVSVQPPRSAATAKPQSDGLSIAAIFAISVVLVMVFVALLVWLRWPRMPPAAKSEDWPTRQSPAKQPARKPNYTL